MLILLRQFTFVNPLSVFTVQRNALLYILCLPAVIRWFRRQEMRFSADQDA
jgi:hypothetical protein